jgi:hypothetical protein
MTRFKPGDIVHFQDSLRIHDQFCAKILDVTNDMLLIEEIGDFGPGASKRIWVSPTELTPIVINDDLISMQKIINAALEKYAAWLYVPNPLRSFLEEVGVKPSSQPLVTVAVDVHIPKDSEEDFIAAVRKTALRFQSPYFRAAIDGKDSEQRIG